VAAADLEALRLEPEDVARVGFALRQYADDHESQETASTQDDWLARGHTLADAAGLLVFVDRFAAAQCLSLAAVAFEHADNSFAWTCEVAGAGAWNPERPVSSPDPVDVLLGTAFYRVSDRPHGGYEFATLGLDDAAGISAIGVPLRVLSTLADAAGERDADVLRTSVGAVIERADEVLELAMADDWHWRRLVGNVRPAEPELIAAGVVARFADHDAGGWIRDRRPSPARGAVHAGVELADDLLNGRLTDP